MTVFGDGWTDPGIRRFMRRTVALQEHGLRELEAECVAQTMLYRERPGSGDDRRLCLECEYLRKDGVCTNWYACKAPKRFEPCRTVLWRCDGFKLKGT